MILPTQPFPSEPLAVCSAGVEWRVRVLSVCELFCCSSSRSFSPLLSFQSFRSFRSFRSRPQQRCPLGVTAGIRGQWRNLKDVAKQHRQSWKTRTWSYFSL